MWTWNSVLLSFHLHCHVEFLHNGWLPVCQNLIEIRFQLKHLIWDCMVDLDIHHVHENSWYGSMAVPVSLPACVLCKLISLALSNIFFHHYFPNTFTFCSEAGGISLTICYCFGHKIKGKSEHYVTDFVSPLRFFFIIFDLMLCLPLAVFWHPWWYLDGLYFPSPTLRFCMTDNRCNIPVFDQIDTATFPSPSITKMNKQCRGLVDNRVIEYIEMLTPHFVSSPELNAKTKTPITVSKT